MKSGHFRILRGLVEYYHYRNDGSTSLHGTDYRLNLFFGRVVLRYITSYTDVESMKDRRRAYTPMFEVWCAGRRVCIVGGGCASN